MIHKGFLLAREQWSESIAAKMGAPDHRGGDRRSPSRRNDARR
jgi:hypothetical protein